MNCFRLIFSVLLGLCLWVTDAATGQVRARDFPYQALVISESAPVHSGPGRAHYATDELQQNAVVDVYRHDPGGWCAIRPPAGSFSLVPESVVEKSTQQVGRITQDGVQAWVGTRLGSVEQPMWQVKLKLGEQVAILGETSWPNPEGDATTWMQIAPPAGEFRWIRSSDIKLPKHLTDLPEVEDRQNLSLTQLIESELPTDEIGGRGKSAQTGFQESDPMFDQDEFLRLDPPSEKDGTVNRGWKQATHPIRVADRRTDGGRIEPFKTPAVDIPSLNRSRLNSTPGSLPTRDTTAGNLPPTNPSSASSSYDPALTMISPISGPVSARIRELEFALTNQLLEPPAQWQLEPILRQATAISSSTNDVQEQQHALRLVDKIRNCANLQSSFETAYNGPPPATSTSLPVGTGIDAGLDDQVQLGTTYDAFGWLNELVRDKGKMSPTYVLEDDQGKIIYHIAPAPGLNLNRYLNNKVGVIGRRGFHRNLNMNHVTAERIVVLETLRR